MLLLYLPVNVCFTIQDASFLYMGRLLEGFGVGIISYTVCNRRFLACLFPAKNFVFQNYGTSAVVSVRGKKRLKIKWDSNIVELK